MRQELPPHTPVLLIQYEEFLQHLGIFSMTFLPLLFLFSRLPMCQFPQVFRNRTDIDRFVVLVCIFVFFFQLMSGIVRRIMNMCVTGSEAGMQVTMPSKSTAAKKVSTIQE